MKRSIAAVFFVVALSGCASKPTTTPAPVAPAPSVAPTSAASSTAATVANPCAPGKDMGCGTPDAECSTNRLGKQFILDGVVYTCGGEKPYKWRR
jgi:hypothetical protein